MAAEEKAVQVMPVTFLNTADKIMENYENSSYNKMVKSPFEIMVAAVLAGMFMPSAQAAVRWRRSASRMWGWQGR